MLNVARALYFQSRSVPLTFWSEYVTTATFLINHTPSPLLGNKTPFELLYEHATDYSFLKTFGCLAFAFTLAAHRTKFEPRARLCVFIGYPIGMKGYKLYDLATKQIFVSRDVVFHEHIFPFHSVSTHDTLSYPFPDLVLPYPFIDNHSDHTPTSLRSYTNH